MFEPRRILCPVDFSDYSRVALRHAFALAHWYGAHLTVLYVEHELLALARAKVAQGWGPALDSKDDLRAFIRPAQIPSVSVQLRELTGDPAQHILEAAHVSVDLIVMGTRGRSGVARMTLGSVTERVLRQARCPVMTIPPGVQGEERADLQRYETIVCASDFSPASWRALDCASSMAQRTDASLVLVHVMQWPTDPRPGLPAPVVLRIQRDRDEAERTAYQRLSCAWPDDAGFRYRPQAVVAMGHAGEAILKLAIERNAELVVMGVQSRSAVDMLVFGSTTQHVVRAAHCPVLSVRAAKEDAHWPECQEQAHETSGAGLNSIHTQKGLP